VNLAYHDLRRHPARFAGTAVGLGLLFTVVLAMAGIYEGLVDDATILARTMSVDLWVVQRGTRGPFADASALDPSAEARLAAIPGIASARSYTYLTVQRDHRGESIRLALVGLAWPEDHGEQLPLIAGRPLAQAHGEVIADASLGLAVGELLRLADDDYRVVGLTRNALGIGGDGAAFLTVADAQLTARDTPPDAVLMERERGKARLRASDLGRAQPALAALLDDPRWRPPVVAAPPINAVLLRLDDRGRLPEVRQLLARWGDVSVYDQQEQEELLLQGVVRKARMQLGLFSAILTLTASVLLAMVVHNLTAEKTHDLAVLKLMGTPSRRIAGLVLQQAWLLGVVAYLVALLVGHFAFPHFARRVVLTDEILSIAPILVFVVTTLASALGVSYALRVDVNRVLEG
jgi:putative ABC transport system permease protein